MLRKMRQLWIVPAVLVLLPIGFAIGPALGQQRDGSRNEEIASAREIAQLMDSGQMLLPQAVEMAEKHTGGKSLLVTSTVKLTDLQRPRAARPNEPSEPGQVSASKRLIYEVKCFSGDKLKVVTIDGLERKITGTQEPGGSKSPEAKPKPDDKQPDKP